MVSFVPRPSQRRRTRWIGGPLVVVVWLALLAGVAACRDGSSPEETPAGATDGDTPTVARDQGERLGEWLRRLDDGLDEERVVVFPSWGSLDDDAWTVRVSAWVAEPREKLGTKVASGVSKVEDLVGDLPDGSQERLRDRLADWVAEGEDDEDLVFRFDADAEGAVWPGSESEGRLPETDDEGETEGLLRLSEERARGLREVQGAATALTLRPAESEQTGGGRVHLLPAAGLSVIADVDDTLRATDNPGGLKSVIRTTFLNDFVALPETRQKIAELAARGAQFHYVSSAPVQLFRPYATWAEEEAEFPRGTWHLRQVPRSVRSVDDLETLPNVLSGGGQASFCHKVREIEAFLEAFPERRVVMLGDSGGCDPEVYRSFRERYGERVEEIWIRDTVAARLNTPERLAGMTVVEVITLGDSDCSVEVGAGTWRDRAEDLCL